MFPAQCKHFVQWAKQQLANGTFAIQASKGTSRGQLSDLRFVVNGTHVEVLFEFFTADAAGQNMAMLGMKRYVCHRCNGLARREWEAHVNDGGLEGIDKLLLRTV